MLVENVVRSQAMMPDQHEKLAVEVRPVEDVYALAYAGKIMPALVFDTFAVASPGVGETVRLSVPRSGGL